MYRALSQQVKWATEARTIKPNNNLQQVGPGEWVYIKTFKRKWNEVRRTGPYQVILATPTAVQIISKNGWYHLNHCTHPKSTSGKTEKTGRGNPDRRRTNSGRRTIRRELLNEPLEERPRSRAELTAEQEDIIGGPATRTRARTMLQEAKNRSNPKSK